VAREFTSCTQKAVEQESCQGCPCCDPISKTNQPWAEEYDSKIVPKQHLKKMLHRLVENAGSILALILESNSLLSTALIGKEYGTRGASTFEEYDNNSML
jgi:hypothetical protein